MNDPRETLNRIRKQADNATEGPWRHISIFEVGGFVEDPYGRDIFDWAQDDAGTICAPDPDAEFIAAARTTVPHLVDALEKVLILHKPVEVEPSETICSGCSTLRGQGEMARYFPFTEYPCPTVEAITTALEAHRG